MVIVHMPNYYNDLVPLEVPFKQTCINFHLYYSAVEFMILISEKVLINLLYKYSLTVGKV